jgi:hypothetical protein
VETPSRESEEAVETERLRLGQGSGRRARVGETEGEGRLRGNSALLLLAVVLLAVVCWGSGVEEDGWVGARSVLCGFCMCWAIAADGCVSIVVCFMSASCFGSGEAPAASTVAMMSSRRDWRLRSPADDVVVRLDGKPVGRVNQDYLLLRQRVDELAMM